MPKLTNKITNTRRENSSAVNVCEPHGSPESATYAVYKNASQTAVYKNANQNSKTLKQKQRDVDSINSNFRIS